MKNLINIISALSIVMAFMCSCQREQLPVEENKESSITHTVHFVAEGPETKTSYSIKDDDVTYSWSDSDANTDPNNSKFTVYENGTPASEVTATLTGGLMYLSATFSGEESEESEYQAVFNAEVSTEQDSDEDNELYDQESDVLISNTVKSNSGKDMLFSFRREVAMAKMTLTGLAKGTQLLNVKVSSDKVIAGTYSMSKTSFTDGVNDISITTSNDITSGSATVYFVTTPFSEANLTVEVKTTSDGENASATYRKTFGPISFTRGNVRDFTVNLADCEEIFYESFDDCNGTGGNDGKWSGEIATEDAKLNSDKWGSSQRGYAGSKCIKLGTSAKDGSATTKVLTLNGNYILKFKAGSWTGDNTTLTLSTSGQLSTNSFSLEDSKFTNYDVTIETSSSTEITFSGNKQFFLDEVGIYPAVETHTITGYESANGSITSSVGSAHPGSIITLTPSPNSGYMIKTISVKDADDKTISLSSDYKFTMPVSNVTVSAEFVKIWNRVTEVSEITSGGTFIIGYEATANSGVIVPMRTEGTLTTSKAGVLYSGTTEGSSGNGTINMSTIASTSAYEVTITSSSIVAGAINIKIGDNYLGNTNTKNNCKLFTSEATTTAFTPTIDDNDIVTLTIKANTGEETNYTTLQYNKTKNSERFAVYADTQQNLVLYKKTSASTSN